MPPLLHDRYLEISATHACDLATGELVPAGDVAPPAAGQAPLLPALSEVFAHGRDGWPRAVTADLQPLRWRTAVDRIAADAVTHGYVPIGARVYQRMRALIGDHVDGRGLVLISADSTEGAAALIDAATRSPSPHVLVTLRSRPTGAVAVVREARAAYAIAGGRPRTVVWPADVQQHIDRGRRAAEFVRAGRHAAAERLLRDVSAALLRRCAWAPAIHAMVTLGRLLLERGRAMDAVRVFEDAAAAAVTGGDASLEADARIWIATARTDGEQLTAAESICRALLLVGGLPAWQRAWAQAALARVLRHQGRSIEPIELPTADTERALDAATLAFVQATKVRQLVDEGETFAAGLAAGALLASSTAADPLVRIIMLTTRLRLAARAGDLAVCEELIGQIAVASHAARSPLRLVRARLIWADTLRRAGRDRAAAGVFEALQRVAAVAPPLLRHAIARGSRAGVVIAPAPVLPVISASGLVRMAHDEEDDRAAIHALIDRVLRAWTACRVDVWSTDAGPASIVATVGTGLPSTIGERVIDAGIAIGPDGEPPVQVGVPVRLGARVVGAVVARWPADRVVPRDVIATLDLVAAVAAPRLEALLQTARSTAQAATAVPELVGVSRAIADVRRSIARAAAAPFNVLIEGESGVGKELIARAIHQLSPRRERRFCDVNCAALPDDLLESELFGHAKGAFTGAVADRPGLFEEAHGGTLFLDEVVDLTLRAQAKLLRVLQQQEVRRVGENFTRRIDVRLVAAANRDMRVEAEQGRFRQDLLYRVDVIRVAVPALRERPEDIAVLAQHFWEMAAGRVGTRAVLTSGVLAALTAFHWPGNVRELQNVLAALAVAAPARGRVTPSLLPAAVGGALPMRATRLADARVQFERRFVAAALARASGNRARAARALGVSRQGLLKLIDRLHVEESSGRP